MSGVDDRVVQMTFDNSAFEKRLGETLKSLDELSKSLKFQGAQDGFKNISAAADHVNLSSMASSLDTIQSKFSAMGAVGFSIISNLTTSALGFAKTVAEKVLDPILGGGKQRAVNIDNAKFAFRGLGMDVQASMDDALSAVRGTAFGLDEAAKAAAQFGASGIKSGADMTGALRGIAGIAAMTNRSFSEIADIMTSSAATGVVNNQDLQQFATRGLNAAASVAKAMGITEAQVHEMASQGKLDFASFSKIMDDTFGSHAQEANQTFTGALANMHAALSRLGASFIAPQLENQKNLFNALSPAIDGVAKAMLPVINVFTWFSTIKTNKIIEFIGALDFTKLQEPMKNFADGFAAIFDAIGAFIAPIKEAFRTIFPADALGILTKFSDMFQGFAAALKIGGDTADKVRSIFQGLFSVFDIVWNVAKELVFVLADLYQAFSGVGGGTLTFAASLGDALTRLDAWLVKGGKLHEWFLAFRQDLQAPIAFLKALAGGITDLFKSFFSGLSGSDAASSSLDRLNQRIDGMTSGVDRMKDRISGITAVLDKVFDYMKNWFATLGQKIAAAFHPGDFDSAVDIVNVGLLGGIALMLKKFMQGGLDNVFASGTIAKIKMMLGQVTTTLKAMQVDLKADALMKIAIALGVLAGSLVVLSLIDSVSLTKALSAMAVSFGELIAVMAAMDRVVGSSTAAFKLGIIGAAMIEFATAAAVLTLAIRNLSGLSWDELAKGMVGIAGGMTVLVVASKLMGDNALSMAAAGVGMMAISTALVILSTAVRSFATMSWGDMAKGLAGVAGGLILVTAAMNLMPAASVISGMGFIEIAAGLIIMAEAVKQFGKMDWGEMGKGLLGVAGALLIVAGAMQLMPLSLPITAAGLVLVGAALVIMAQAIQTLGNMDFGELAKGIGAVAAMMLILVVATNAMNSALPGAAALVVVSGALLVLATVLRVLGAMDTGSIVKGLISVAATLAILGLGAAVLQPLIPALLGLGIALALIGAAFTLFGIGAYATSKAFEEMAKSGVEGAKAFIESIKIIATGIPEIIKAVILGIVNQGEELLKAVPLLLRLITAVLDQLLDTIIQLAPKLGKALVELFRAGFAALSEAYPDYIRLGFKVLVAILQGIRDNIAEVTVLVAEIVLNFLDAFGAQLPAIVDGIFAFVLIALTTVAHKLGESQWMFIPVGIAFLTGFMDGMTTYLPTITGWFVGLPGNILGWLGDVIPTLFQKGVDLITGMVNGLVSAVPAVTAWFIGLPGNILGWLGDVIPTLFDKGVDLLKGFLNGIVVGVVAVTTWFIGLPGNILGWLGDVVPTLVDKGVDIIKGFLNGIVIKALDVIAWFIGLPGNILGWLGDVVPTLVDKGVDLIKGLLNGIVEKAVEVGDWFIALPGVILGFFATAVDWLKDKGLDIVKGLWNGIIEKWHDVVDWAVTLKDTLLNLIGDALSWLKQTGINVLTGLWNGILSMKDWFVGKMGEVAGWVTDPIGSALSVIGAPSRVMCEMGKKAGRGLANGLLEMQKPVEDASAGLGQSIVDGFDVDTSVEAINRIFNEIVSQLDGMDDFNPTITPVLDLTNVKMGARNLNDLFNKTQISPVASFEQARTISTTADLAKSAADAAAATAPSEVTFNQYNNSPKPLSTNDIYRGTKSQIALAKEELDI